MLSKNILKTRIKLRGEIIFFNRLPYLNNYSWHFGCVIWDYSNCERIATGLNHMLSNRFFAAFRFAWKRIVFVDSRTQIPDLEGSSHNCNCGCNVRHVNTLSLWQGPNSADVLILVTRVVKPSNLFLFFVRLIIKDITV